MNQNNTGTQVIQRACQILRCFDEQHTERSLGEIVRLTELKPPTAHRILQALVTEGLILQDVSTSRYQLGYSLIKMGDLARKSNDLVQTASRYLQDLAHLWGEATVVDVPDQNLFMVSVLLIPSTYRLGTTSSYDRPAWAHATAAGKAILAYLPDHELEKFLANQLPAFTNSTITDPILLRKELELVTRQRYATNYEEQELGLFAVGAPIFDHTNRAIAALSIGGPSARIAGENFSKIANSLIDTADRISLDLGYIR